ncbi:VOC family protein [Agriterribacter sp.]|uniref:VOC family protein n=1 Tax=Agriterribacter sp. TaxID=2821509 RepID=UPI002C2F1F69|nr:VOC family protein [Agriterribacter sp.]HTN08580.1 VOC family protein [Agriterribacter sp.]
MNIPNGHQQLMPYLISKNPRDFIRFASTVFGAVPGNEHLRDDGITIMHAEVKIGECTIMFAQATEQWPSQTANLFIYVTNADASYATALENGASSLMEPADQSYGRACGVKDPSGNTWWITGVQ